ncbi:extracellular solute-binding protein [Paenibacillus sp. IB182496]|uniref:Extracellular solute-binding protein n=1 Tax=Paenibacillus sabuli TaxID=2772509 RepID=A0A927GSY5_9BACL|nr:extracellular solute-binding protein [Paenibacillus sabuli]MBD2847053.1 extracellular solute-binding protein [Paenibacillus sabuli]
MMKKAGQVMGILLLVLAIVGCSANGGNSGNNSGASGNNGGNEEPAEMETVRVSIWDRGTAPEGQQITDTLMSRWINEQVAELGIQIEFVPLPRSEESAKLSAWMASGTAPDVVLTYDANTFLKFASQGGLAPLDESIEAYGQDLMENNKEAMEAAGTYEDTRYAVMAKKPNTTGPTMSIRQDWLDEVGMDVPTTVDELYEVLKAFKEQDPGDVGADKVIPYSIPAFGQSMKGFMYGVGFGLGMKMDGPGTQIYLPTGNIKDGEFHSGIVTEEGRALFETMNRFYKEGLLPKEFITDVNSQNHSENLLAGRVGFVDSNEPAYNLDKQMREKMPDVDWVTVEPFVAPDGSQMITAGYPFGMFIMVPKTSADKTDAVIKYLNWMSDPDVMVTLMDGFEGEQYTMEDGLRLVIDPDKKKNEISWYSSDLAIMSLGLPWYPSDTALIQYETEGEWFATKVVEYREIVTEYAEFQPLLTNERPFGEKNTSSLDAMLYEELSKIIIADDFDTAYEAMLKRWEQMGGPTYDEEVTAGLKEIGWIE